MKAPMFHTTATNNSLSSCLISQVPNRMVELNNSWSSTLTVDNDDYNNENDLKSSNGNNKNTEALHNDGMKKNKNGHISHHVKFNEDPANAYLEDYYNSEYCSREEQEQENVVDSCWYNDDDYKDFLFNTNFVVGHFIGLDVQLKQKGECGFTSVI
eukprot:CAMPEP_0198138220 /NCGR_PEP_ID=MMETSP1443-20131203/1646_1 /TAXON_ID=186043 /ORGANISM="Entomoneis sp., Strain CCMP2396" /LENGTH=155 /DNA_ID=CAMNT_0043799907 /DNA_START=171 /DNA_END=636 /DNA_ORIENTATION=-